MENESHRFHPSQPTRNVWDASEDEQGYLRKVKVEMEVHMLDINPKKGTFAASVRCNLLVRFPKEEDEQVKSMKPSIRVPSCDIEEKEARLFDESKLSTETSTMWRGILSFKLTGTEPFEVQDFPFDRQVIDLNLLDFRWMPGRTAMEIADFTVRTYSKLAAWDTYFAMVETKKTKAVENGPQCSGRFNVKLRLERRPEYYITNIFLVTCGILIASLLPMGMDVDEVGDRLQVYAGGMLTLVAFKYGVAEQLPSVPYSTSADMFLSGQTATLVFAMTEGLVSHKLVVTETFDKDTVNHVEDGLLIFLVLLWMAVLLYFSVVRKNSRRSWKSVLENQETNAPEKSGD